MCERSCCSTSGPAFGAVGVRIWTILNRCVVVCHCCFNSRFPDDIWQRMMAFFLPKPVSFLFRTWLHREKIQYDVEKRVIAGIFVLLPIPDRKFSAFYSQVWNIFFKRKCSAFITHAFLVTIWSCCVSISVLVASADSYAECPFTWVLVYSFLWSAALLGASQRSRRCAAREHWCVLWGRS